MTSAGTGLVLELPWMDPADAFLRFADDAFVTFFESGGPGGARSRYSYLCIDPVQVLRNATLHDLAAELARWPRGAAGPVPFTGGAAGFLGYDMGAELDGVVRPPGAFPGVPDMQFGLYDVLFAWDHAAHASWLICAFEAGRHRAEKALARLRLPAEAVVTPALRWTEPVSRAAHMARVERTLDYILAGDIYQANITAPFSATRPAGLLPADIFLALRQASPAPFSAYIGCDADCAVTSVSPERFLRLDASGRIETRPIKGTRPRGATPAEDAVLADALLSSAKDRAENLMIVDLLRNDISRVALPGSVHVPSLCVLESFANVHHLVSEVVGQLRPGCTAVDLLRAAFPGGSITGAPKIRAMEIIAEMEGVIRGPYCGAAVWIGFDGAMDSNILIRTVTVAQDRVVAQAGGGIVADSNAADEWQELLVKIGPLLRALDPAWV